MITLHHPQFRLNQSGNLVHTVPQGRLHQVCIALSGSSLGVAEKFADHFERRPAGYKHRGKGMPQIMHAHIGEVRCLLYRPPKAPQILNWFPQ